MVAGEQGADALSDRLSALGVEVNVGYWDGRGWLRPCAQAPTTIDDFHRLAAVLPAACSFRRVGCETVTPAAL